MRCGILGDRESGWVTKMKPQVDITPSDFDTLTQTFEGAGDTDSPQEDWKIGQENPTIDGMYITAVKASVIKGGLWEVQITWTGIYPTGKSTLILAQRIFYDQTSNSSIQKLDLLKPVQSSVRTYVDTVEDLVEGTIYRTRTPRLTTTEKYVTTQKPDNKQLGKTGRPFNPPSEVQIINQEFPWAVAKNNVRPFGWILNTRSWTQVLDKDLYTITDEWVYQIPQQWKLE